MILAQSCSHIGHIHEHCQHADCQETSPKAWLADDDVYIDWGGRTVSRFWGKDIAPAHACAFWSPSSIDADLRNFNEVWRTRFYDLIQIVVLISLRIFRAICGTNSHQDWTKMWGVTVLWTARYDVGSGLPITSLAFCSTVKWWG